MAAPISQLTELLRQAQRIFVFTGAGISTASKIPDFRGPNGLYRSNAPVYYDDFIASEAARRQYWEFKLGGYTAFRDARPTDAHRAIVSLEQLGKVERVVTQNVDGLHQLAGTARERLIELHGTNAQVECIGCGERESPERAVAEFERTREPPRCTVCGDLVKPAVVLFGQSLRADDLAAAAQASRASDLVLSLGSSLVVTPAAELPLLGVRRGAPYVIVNQGPTPHDALATIRFDDDLNQLLPRAVQAI